MSRMSVFNSPFLLGFEQFERSIDRISKLSSDSYPPYNIEQLSSNLLRITIAVAGFEKKDLEISLEGNQLQIKGFRPEDDSEKIFIHRGIATRQFQRNFILAESEEIIKTISVSEAMMLMNLNDQSAIFFKNSQTKRLNILFKRSDGNIGWLDPKK